MTFLNVVIAILYTLFLSGCILTGFFILLENDRDDMYRGLKGFGLMLLGFCLIRAVFMVAEYAQIISDLTGY